MSQWQAYSEKFNHTSMREKYMIIATGVIGITFLLYFFFLDAPFQRISQLNKNIVQTELGNKNNLNSIELLEQALQQDPNVVLNKELEQYQAKLGEIDQQLLSLTSDLIDPIQMRYALIKLLKLQSGVKLLSFEVLPAQPVRKDNADTDAENDANDVSVDENQSAETEQLRLYRHGIKIKLQGKYFQLRKYLTQLEDLSWKFFWQEFDYQLKEYPVSELEVEIYSLSTAQEFIGV